MAESLKHVEENELVLELSIGGIFGDSKKTNPNTIEKDDQFPSKREIQLLRRRRKREENLKKPGSFLEDKEWLENDEVLEIEPACKKERIPGLDGFMSRKVVSGQVVTMNEQDVNKKKSVCGRFNPYNIILKPDEGEPDRQICKVNSNGSGSMYSDGQCSSHQGVATDDDRSNSSNSQLDQQLANTTADPYDQPAAGSSATYSEANPPGTSKEASSVLGRMPCVSTTGNGPNGKTISGFLYRYTKNEVSIVCVCHGESFSPAGFVEHAGGVDIAHPLKHITIFPIAFAS